ncbi:phosphopantothenoylcysteine decarboxylase-like [Ptychodera flava]|uniref:phosphopantothenoylcysteine decarboxylase-like n=1 Tax=Ptychodera flava TaxID=63121 RepID=UPI003969DF74
MMADDREQKESSTRKRVLLGCTGSVASIKVPRIIEELFLRISSVEIEIVATEYSQKFFDVTSLPEKVKVHTDAEEWQTWQKMEDPVLHVELRRWADVLVIAPLDANTLAKISHGICDNLLTCTVRAWDLKKPLLFCPAMNTNMWEHPLTSRQVTTLKEFGYLEVPCIEKKLACGDIGYGAMAEVSTIVTAVKEAIS